MNWLTGGTQGEVKKLIAQLADLSRRDSAAQELIKLGAESVPLLIDALQTQDPSLLHYVQQILVRIPSAATQLINALTNANPIIRARAAQTLGISKNKSAVSALLNLLKDSHFTVRSQAVLALGNIGDAQILHLLLPMLKDKDEGVRSAACIVIAKFRDPATFDEIANVLLDDPKIEVRQSAAIALGDTKNPAAIPFLMEALRDSLWWYEREQAVKDLLNAIEKMGDAVVEPLIDALRDKEGTVRKFAAAILGNLGDPRALEELGMALYDMHHEVGQVAAEALVKFGSKALDIFIESLSHPEAGVRRHAIKALGNIKDVRVTPILIEVLNDPDRENQKQAVVSLAKLRDPRGLTVLREIASNRADREMSALAKQILETLP